MQRKKIKKRQSEFNILREYKKSWEYLKDIKLFIYLITGVFLLFVLIGLFIPAPEIIYDKILDFIKDLLKQTQDMSLSQLIGFIISNNIKSTFFAIVFGIFLGIYPISTAVINGYVLGFVSLISIENGGLISLWRLFPHGIFELPAVFISMGVGLKFGTFILQKNKIKAFKEYLINSLRIFLLIVIPLLIIAGIIEGTIMRLVN